MGFTERSDFYRGDLEKTIYRGRLPKNGGRAWTVSWFKGGGIGKKEEGGVFEGGGIDTPMPTMIILSHLVLSRIDLTKLNSSILKEIVTVPVGQVDEFHFYMHYNIKA